MKSSEKLRAVATKISLNPSCWIQETAYEFAPEDKDRDIQTAIGACAGGHCEIINGGSCRDLTDWLDSAIPASFPGKPYGSYPYIGYNDAPGRTPEEIVAWFLTAAAFAEEAGQ